MPDLNDIVICNPLRTAVGGFGGMYRALQAHELGAQLLRGIIDQTGLPGDVLDDVIFAQCFPSMEAPAIGRVIALDAGLAASTPGIQLDRRCGSGLQAIIYGIMTVASGGAELVIVGGAESMSNAPFFTDRIRWGQHGNFEFKDSLQQGRIRAGGKNFPVPGGMIETAENLRRDYSISRERQDEFAFNSHQKAAAAQRDGRFEFEILPVSVHDRKRGTISLASDEHIRPDISLDRLASLNPIMKSSDPSATVTAGNASGQNDGAAAAIVCTRSKASELGLEIYGSLRGWAVAGVAPDRMGIGPVASTKKALERVGLSLSDINVIELNEAFAAQALAVLEEWDLAPVDGRLNPNGSGISLGHPVGATGARLTVSLLHQLKRNGGGLGLVTMCIGGGQGLSAVFESTA